MYVELVLFAVIVIQAIMHYIARRELCDRIMCKNIDDYNHAKARDKPDKKISRHDEVLRRWRDPNGGAN